MKAQSSSEKQPLQIHLAVFAPNLPKKVSQLLKDTERRTVLSYNEWHISKLTQYQRLWNIYGWQWNLIFPFMISASCSILWLDNNRQEKIIMSISKTNFMELQLLDLGTFIIKTDGNNIRSIEQLQFIKMPLLERLYLSQNKITKTSALNKCKWSNLKELFLRKNSIQQLEIERLQMNDQECGENSYNGDQHRGHNWIVVSAKMNFNQIQLWKSEKGIKPRQRLLKCLKEKKMQIRLF